jgi:filamentous hemagglutinin family protein
VGGSLTVSQTSSHAIVSWSSFSIGQGGTVTFDNGSGATLNRVTGGSVSAIDGRLSATGSVYLINPNGVIVGKSGEVQVGGSFVASSLDLADANFLGGGDQRFSGASAASVVNLGKIGALGGDVVLMAATVKNAGTISAPNGDVGLVSGHQVLMRDLALDDGKFAVEVGGAGTSATNSGLIEAAQAELRAEGGNVYALAGNPGSVIRASGVTAHDGRVFLVAEGGQTVAQGQIEATGQVETSGESVDFDGLQVRAPSWLVDPFDLTVDAAAAATIASNLATTNVTLQTTAVGTSGPGNASSGAGDIDIDAAISWSTPNLLTLDAYHGVNINAPVTVGGAGKVAILTNDGGSGGQLSFLIAPLSGPAGSLAFTGTPNTGQQLTLNGAPYTLLYSMADVAGVASAPAGSYALATPLDASGTTYADAVVTGVFSGSFNGLGNAISNLAINAPSATSLGLFANIGPTGALASLQLTRANVVGAATANYGGAGILVGRNSGTITNVAVAGVVGGNLAYGGAVGGLAGYNDGTIGGSKMINGAARGGGTDTAGGLVGYNDTTGALAGDAAYAFVSDNQFAGGLVGVNLGSISASWAAGPVIATNAVGGLAGFNSGSITGSGASGAVTGSNEVGGLVGWNDASGALSADSAAGATVSTSSTYGGGLVGYNNGTITNASASDNLTVAPGTAQIGGLAGFNGGTITGDNASGNVTVVFFANFVGGLAGVNNGSISGSFTATGIVGGSGGSSDVGGLVGLNAPMGTLSGDNSSEATTDRDGQNVGGLAGENDGSISDSGAAGSVAGFARIGGLVGDNIGTISSGSWAAGSATGRGFVGGLAGLNESTGAIMNSGASFGAVTATGSDAGGLVGRNDGLIAGASTANATVSSPSLAGGLAGANSAAFFNNIPGTISNSISSDTVVGTVVAGEMSGQAGGLVGLNQGNLTQNAASGPVTGAIAVGGLVGDNSGNISNSIASGGTVTGSGAVGGLVGTNGFNGGSAPGLISNDVATEAVVQSDAAGFAGGLVGRNSVVAQIADTYATGSVTGAGQVGGLIGQNDGAIRTSYAIGFVSGSGALGGVIGKNTGGAFNVYWDVASSGQVLATATNTGGLFTVDGVGGSTGNDPHQATYYPGFDFTTIWNINPGMSRPYLRAIANNPPP